MSVVLGPYEFVAGDTGVNFLPTITDYQGQPINITGATQLRVYGKSADLPSNNIDRTDGTVFDGPSGVAKFTEFGNSCTVATLGALASATYRFRVMLTDNAGKVIHTPQFDVIFVHRPI